MKKLLDFKTIGFAGFVIGTMIYYLKDMLIRGSFTVDNIWLYLTFVGMVMWCLAYMISHILKLNKTIEDMKQILETIVENQLESRIVAEKLHRNTRVLLLEAITEGGSNGGSEKRIRVMGRK